MSIIKDLFYGNAGANPFTCKNNQKYLKSLDIIQNAEREFEQSLDEEKMQLFSRLMKAQDDILDIEVCESFIDGWKMGARFMLDTFIQT